MDRYEKAALLDFVASVIWPTRTVRLVTTPAGESEVDVIGTWKTATDIPMAWVNGNRISGVTWVSPTRVALGQTVAMGKQVIVLVSPGSGSGYLPRNPAGVVDMLGDLMMGPGPGGLHRIRHLGAAVESDDGVRLDQVQSLIQATLGGNYVAKAGDQMAGALLLANDDPTKGAAAVRRSLVALLDASQSFTGKIKAPSTIDTDPATTLTTKDWVQAYVQAQLANTQAPNQEEVFSTAGSGYTWTAPAGVRKVWVYCKGGKGGKSSGPNVAGAATIGGFGGTISGSIPVGEGATFDILVGGNGGTPATKGGNWPNAGGGGGGGTRVLVGSDAIVGGGGGGGGGNGDNTEPGAAGGAGGQAGRDVWKIAGGAAGNNITTAGGIGGSRGNVWGMGTAGGPGSGFATPAFNTSDTFPFQAVTDPNAVSGSGLVIIKWFEA